jgi:hypothetical protein
MATKKTDDQALASTELDAGGTTYAPLAPIAPASPVVAAAPASAPAPAAPPASLAVDDFHGQGGEYEIVDGVRRLVSRTEVIDPTRAPDAEVNPTRA